MRIIAIIEEQEVIRKILEHLKLWEEPRSADLRFHQLSQFAKFANILPQLTGEKALVLAHGTSVCVSAYPGLSLRCFRPC